MSERLEAWRLAKAELTIAEQKAKEAQANVCAASRKAKAAFSAMNGAERRMIDREYAKREARP